MKIKITDHWAQLVEDDTLRQNSPKTYDVEFLFDGSWDGFTKTAIFEAGSASVVVALTEDCCAFPAECLKRGGVVPRVGVYGVKGGERRATIWCETSRVLYDGQLNLGQGSGQPAPDDLYSEIMAAIGDLSAAGFEGKTLAEIFIEIRQSIGESATDEEVDCALNAVFGPPGESGSGEAEDFSNTATDEEMDKILDDVFGEES